jgi:predicted acetyltransferase
MDIDIRPITSDEIAAFRTAVTRGFGGDIHDEDTAPFAAMLPLERTLAAFDGDAIVGTFGDLPFDLTMPGGADLPMAGTTMVTVRPTHRRRGVMRAMMTQHLRTAIDRGDPVAGLWASESAIYGRFGFGSAVDRHDLELDARTVEMPSPDPDVRVDLVEVDVAKAVIPDLYEQVRTRWAGSLGRPAAWWRHRRFDDPEHWRNGMTARRFAIAYRGAVPIGYVMYRQKEKWEGFLPDGEVSVIEVIATDDPARRALWSFLTTIDLFPRITWWNAAIDDPLPWELSDGRRVKRTLGDSLWLRVLDVPRVLGARRYDSDGRVVIDVADPYLEVASGVYAVEVADGVAEVLATHEPADVALDVRELGALSLGGRSAHQYWRAGLVAGEEEAVRRLDRLFTTIAAPWCPEVF